MNRATQAGLIGLLLLAFVVHGCGGARGSADADRAETSASESSKSAPTTSSSAPRAPLRRSHVPEDPNRLTAEIDAQEYASWLDELGETELDADDLSSAIDDMEWLADGYGGQDGNRLVSTIPGEGSRVRSDLRAAAKQLKSGDKALRRGEYKKAEKAFDRATRALKDLRRAARHDVTAVEHIHRLRLTRDGAVPADASTELATVISWVDGDTVDTDRGRVRVLGINTPEMHEECQPAQEAKDAASQLASAGQSVRLVNPESVRDTDKHGRLLRYVDVLPSGATSSGVTIDLGYSLLLSNLAEARYDSQDGYQWHPRESAYRSTNAKPASGGACPVAGEQEAFVLASVLAQTKDEDEYWRNRIITKVVGHLHSSAAKTLKSHVKAVRKKNQKAEKAAKERAQRTRRQALAHQPERSTGGSSSGNSSTGGSTSSGGGSYPGYTGPRCYAPGGKSWTPC